MLAFIICYFNLSEKTITNACKAAFEYEISPYVGQTKAQVTFGTANENRTLNSKEKRIFAHANQNIRESG